MALVGCAESPLVSADRLEQCGRTQANCGDGPVFVISELAPVLADDEGMVGGFNVDGVVSDEDDRDGCEVPDLVAPDGRQGIDNRLTDLLNQTSDQIREYVPPVLQSAISNGGLLFLIELVGLDDRENDDKVGIVVRRSSDLPLLGTDQLILDSQTFRLAFDHYVGSTDTGRIEDGVLKAGPFTMRMISQFFGRDIRFEFRNIYVEMELADDELSGFGTMGGTIPIADILGIADVIDATGGDGSVPVIRALVPPLADVRGTESDDCDELSFAVTAGARLAFVYDDVPLELNEEPLTGPQIFANLGCIQCHTVRNVPGAEGTTGPELDGLGVRADRAPTQAEGREYVIQSLINPDFYIVPGYEEGVMPIDTRERITADEFETLVDWLMTL